MADNKKIRWTQINIRQSADDLFQRGPSLSIGIAPLGNNTGMLSILAQIDTGAHGTGISPRVAEKLSLSPAGHGEIREAGRKPIACPYYPVRLSIDSIMDIELEVVGLPALGAPHDPVIGRDVLANCRLAIDFSLGHTALFIKAS